MIPPDQNSSFVANMEMVLEVYKRPLAYENPVVCMDESPKQLITEKKLRFTQNQDSLLYMTTSINVAGRVTYF